MAPEMREGLQPFVTAQDPVWDRVTHELTLGQKTSHWMWFVFPQLRVLGHSDRALFYGLSDLAEARAYAAHDILGPRLDLAATLLLAWTDRSAERILGEVDGMKLRSCATLFAETSLRDTFLAVLEQFYDAPCPETQEFLTNRT